MRGDVLHVGATYLRRAVVGLLWVCCGVAWAQTRPLNDTGITFSGNAASAISASCLVTDPAGQDCRYGRDAAALAGTLPAKVGGSGGTNGFDFTKVCNSGQIAGSGTCPANPTTPGYGTNEWGCTKDNVTGLLWEVKTTTGLRSMSHTYTWYMTASPDGNNGTPAATTGTATCATLGRCDTEQFVMDVNAQSVALCGLRDWRMPSVKELEGISDFGRASPAIDPTFFVNTPGSYFWSGSPYAGFLSYAWVVYVGRGGADYYFRSTAYQVRLVRGG